MKSLRLCLLFLACAFAPAAPGATAAEAAPPHPLATPETELRDPARDPAWQELFARLTAQKTRQSKFEERRYFPFRSAPVVLTGEIRIVPERGLSLRYLAPDPRVLIVDAQGVLLREADGRNRAMPDDARAKAATSAIGNVLRFDLGALQRDFAVHGRRDGAAWSLGFVPRAETLRTALGLLVVSGTGATLQKIEMIRSPTQRIEVLVSDTEEDVLFTGDTLVRFFR